MYRLEFDGKADLVLFQLRAKYFNFLLKLSIFF